MNIKNSYQVIDNKLIAGSYPVSVNKIKTENNLTELCNNNIEVFINLTEKSVFEKIGLIDYQSQITYFYNKLAKKVEIYNYPIKDFSVPTKEYLLEILNKIDDCLKKNKRVYIHCMGGIGRTGVVIGCYLVYSNIVKNTEALDYLKKLRKHLGKESPETLKQKKMIEEWEIYN